MYLVYVQLVPLVLHVRRRVLVERTVLCEEHTQTEIEQTPKTTGWYVLKTNLKQNKKKQNKKKEKKEN